MWDVPSMNGASQEDHDLLAGWCNHSEARDCTRRSTAGEEPGYEAKVASLEIYWSRET